LPDIIRMINSRRTRFFSYLARVGGLRSAYNFLVEKPEEQRCLSTPKHKWKDITKMDPKEIELKWDCIRVT
jgi:hypothetical protein